MHVQCINIDAVGLGVVTRDHDGEVIGALSMRIPLPHFVAEVEALVGRRALQFAAEIRLQEVIFEGNSSMIIQAITEGSLNQAVYGHIFYDIHYHASLLLSCNLCHVK